MSWRGPRGPGVGPGLQCHLLDGAPSCKSDRSCGVSVLVLLVDLCPSRAGRATFSKHLLSLNERPSPTTNNTFFYSIGLFTGRYPEDIKIIHFPETLYWGTAPSVLSYAAGVAQSKGSWAPTHTRWLAGGGRHREVVGKAEASGTTRSPGGLHVGLALL